MPAALAAAMFPSMSAPSSVARRRLMIDAYPILLISWIAAGVMAPAHATVDSTLAKFRMPGTSCLTTCALAAVAIRPTTVNSATVGFSGRMPAPPFERCSLPLPMSPRAPCERQTGATAKDGRRRGLEKSGDTVVLPGIHGRPHVSSLVERFAGLRRRLDDRIQD